MPAKRSAACAAVLLIAFANVLSASDTTFVSQGARVKVFPSMAKPKPVIGEVVKLAYDTLVIVPEGNGSARTFYPGDLWKIEVSQEKGKSHVGKGAWIGALGGAAIGAGIGAAVDCSDYNQGTCVAAVAAMGLAGGALLGVGVGAALSSGERWEEAEFPVPPPVTLNVGKDGSLRLAFSLRL